MQFMDTITNGEQQTQGLAKTLAADLRRGDILLLSGPLGSGKSVFARALIRAACGQPEMDVPSPTFTLVQTYDTPQGTVFHFDLYRLGDPEEIHELGWDEACAGGIVIAEWPERLGGSMPRTYIKITIAPVPGQPESRRIVIEPVGRQT